MIRRSTHPCCVHILRRCVPTLLLALFCFPAAVLILNTNVYRHQPRGAALHQEEPISLERRNTSWNKENFQRHMEARMAFRRRTLKEGCSRFGLDIQGNDTLHRPNPWEFLINKQYHVIWCNVFKAASSSWMYNFNILAGYKPSFLQHTNQVLLQLARQKYPRPSIEELNTALNDSIAFFIVRHPFERLLSAYRDKLQYALANTYHQKLGFQIIEKYRPGAKKIRFSNVPRWPTFLEFTQFLLDEIKAGNELDMHWTPITQFCSPCQVDFDIIMKFDTLNEDQKYFIELAGLEKVIKVEWKNPAKGPITNKAIIKYYNQLSFSQISQLYDFYRYDFELFGYSADKYLSEAKDYGKEETPVV